MPMWGGGSEEPTRSVPHSAAFTDHLLCAGHCSRCCLVRAPAQQRTPEKQPLWALLTGPSRAVSGSRPTWASHLASPGEVAAVAALRARSPPAHALSALRTRGGALTNASFVFSFLCQLPLLLWSPCRLLAIRVREARPHGACFLESPAPRACLSRESVAGHGHILLGPGAHSARGWPVSRPLAQRSKDGGVLGSHTPLRGWRLSSPPPSE